MKITIEKVLREYTKARQEPFAGHPIGTFFRDEIPQRVYATGLVNSSTHLVTGKYTLKV